MSIKIYISTALLFVVVNATANLRAPNRVVSDHSSSLISINSRLVVENGNLDINCEDPNCHIKVRYTITAPSNGQYLFRFIMDKNIPTIVHVNGKKVKTSNREYAPHTEYQKKQHKHHKNMYYSQYKTEGNQVIFNTNIIQGKNTINVEYPYTTSQFETDYGYFKKGRYYNHLTYITWPLNEWQRGKAFKYTVMIRAHRKDGTWKILRRRNFSLKCHRAIDNPKNDQYKKVIYKDYKVQKKEGSYIMQYTHTAALPDSIQCYSGDRDIIPKY